MKLYFPSSPDEFSRFSLSRCLLWCVSLLMSGINTLSSRPRLFLYSTGFYLKYYLYLFLSPFSLETAGIIGCASILLCYSFSFFFSSFFFCETSLEFSPPFYVEFQTLPKWVWQAAAARKSRLSGKKPSQTLQINSWHKWSLYCAFECQWWISAALRQDRDGCRCDSEDELELTTCEWKGDGCCRPFHSQKRNRNLDDFALLSQVLTKHQLAL